LDRPQNKFFLFVLFVSTTVWIFNGAFDIFSGDATFIDVRLGSSPEAKWFELAIYTASFILGSSIFYPIFLSYDQSHRWIGNLTGMFGSLCLGLFRLFAMLKRIDPNQTTFFILEIFLRVPEIMAVFIMTLLFCLQLFRCIRMSSKQQENDVVGKSRKGRRIEDYDDDDRKMEFQYVERLLSPAYQSKLQFLMTHEISNQVMIEEMKTIDVMDQMTMMDKKGRSFFTLPTFKEWGWLVKQILGVSQDIRFPSRLIIMSKLNRHIFIFYIFAINLYIL